MTTILALGAVCWLCTTFVVESELFRPLRSWVRRKALYGSAFWSKTKIDYLVTCHLCAGTWIALGIVTVQPDARPLGTGFIGWLMAGLLVKAVAHLILEGVAVAKRF